MLAREQNNLPKDKAERLQQLLTSDDGRLLLTCLRSEATLCQIQIGEWFKDHPSHTNLSVGDEEDIAKLKVDLAVLTAMVDKLALMLDEKTPYPFFTLKVRFE